jgi:PAS domain S-box-containing protein
VSPRRRATDNAAIARLGEQRRTIVGRAVGVLDSDREVPIDIQPETLRETVALLSVSLEELKVAEEELVQQNEELVLTREAVESNSRLYRRIFEEAPLPYVVTDVCGIIQHANHAAVVLLKRPAELLEGKPLLVFVPLDRRGAFREAINRLRLIEVVHDWRMTLLRHGDGPVPVTIDVRLGRGSEDGQEVIYWVLRPAVNVGTVT